MLSSKVLQNPMSKLAYLGSSSSPELLQFTNLSSLEGGVAVSQVKVELVERELGVLWLRHYEHLSNQVSGISLQAEIVYVTLELPQIKTTKKVLQLF